MSFPADEDHEILVSENIYFPVKYYIKKSDNIYFPVEYIDEEANWHLYLKKTTFEQFDFSPFTKNKDRIYGIHGIDANNHIIYDVKDGELDHDAVNYEQMMSNYPEFQFTRTGFNTFSDNIILDCKNKPIKNMTVDPKNPGSLVTHKYLKDNYFLKEEGIPKFTVSNYVNYNNNNYAAMTKMHMLDFNYSIFRIPKIYEKIFILKKNDHNFTSTHRINFRHYVRLVNYKIFIEQSIQSQQVIKVNSAPAPGNPSDTYSDTSTEIQTTNYINHLTDKSLVTVTISRPNFYDPNFNANKVITFESSVGKEPIDQYVLDLNKIYYTNYTKPTLDENMLEYEKVIESMTNFHVYQPKDNIYLEVDLTNEQKNKLFVTGDENVPLVLGNRKRRKVTKIQLHLYVQFEILFFNN